MKEIVIRLFVPLLALATSSAAWALDCQSNSDGNWDVAGRWNCGRVPTASDTVVIRNGHSISLNVNTAAIQSLTINSGGELQNTGTRTLNLAGNLTVTGSGVINLPNSTISLAANSQWGGTATGSAISLAAINLGARNLTFTATASYTISLSGATPLSNHGSFNNNGANRLVTIEMSGANQAWEIYNTIYPQLLISGSGTKTYSASSIAILGSLTVDAGTTFNTAAATGSNTIGGNLVRDGTFTTAPGSGTWTFNGTSPQTIAGGVTFYNMVVANGGSGVYLSNGNLAIGSGSSGSLQLSGGNVFTGSNKVTVSTPCNNNLISGSGWINGNLQLTFPGFSATCVFRVGDNTTAAPVSLNIPFSGSVGGNAGLTLTASTTPGDHPNIATSGLNAAKSVNRYWTLGTSGDTFGCVQEGSDQYNPGRYIATFTFAASDRDGGSVPANYKVGRFFGGWAAPSATAATATSTTIEVQPANGFAPFGTFAVGEQSGAPTGNGPSSTCSTVTPIAEWRMDEAAWNGTANEVLDSSGNGRHGVAAFAAGSGPTATTSTGSSAYTDGALSTCRYGQFDKSTAPARSYTYVQLNSFPALPSQFTFAGWIRTTDRTASGQRILVNDDAQNGWGFSLGDGAAGSIRFFNRNISNTGAVTGDGSNGNCGVFCVDTNGVIANNTWYFVAVTVNTSNEDVNLYIFNNAGTRLAAVSGKYAGNWFNGSGAVAIGGETAASSEGRDISYHFRGNIDELKVYNTALSESNLKDELKRARGCGTLNHVEFVHDGSALTCSPEPITVLGCTSSASCLGSAADQSGDSFTVTPTAIAGTQWCADAQCATPLGSSFTLTSGAVIYLRKPAATPANTPIRMAGTTSPATNATLQCRNTAANLFGSTTACDIEFFSSGLKFMVPNHMSCSPQTVTIQAVSANNNATACVPAFANVNRDLTMYMGYLNPASGTRAASFDYYTSNGGGTTSSVPSLSNVMLAPTTLSNLYWDNTGTATLVNFRYSDVGQVQLNASVTAPGSNPAAPTLTAITGNQFIAAPASFSFPSLPAAPIKAGDDFTVGVRALNACSLPDTDNGRKAPNFGKETPAENAKIEFNSRIQPSGTNACPNAPCDGTVSGTVANWVDGEATATNATYSEVGTMTLKAGLVSTTYMNSGVAAATGTSATVGPFIPHHFDTTFKPACNNVFTYARQPVDATVIARSKAATTTVNYSNIAGCAVCSKSVTLSNATETAPVSGALSFTALAAARFANGVGKPDSTTPNPPPPIAPTGNPLFYTMTTPQTAPLTVTLRAVDNTYPSVPVTSAGFTEGASSVRSGRARMLNAYGSERLDLQVPFFIEYWTGAAGWQKSTDDACTGLNAPTHPASYGAGVVILDRPAANYTCVWDKGTAGGESTSGCTPTAGVPERRYRDADSGHDLIPPGTVATFGADFNLWLRAPAAAGFGAGTVRAVAKVPSWLQFRWSGTAYSDPVARVTFGVIRSGPIIYRREAY